MRVELKNWLGVLVLLCLGFILGRVTMFPDVNANPQKSEIGRYQLLIGEAEYMDFIVDDKDSIIRSELLVHSGLFRIDTMTGDVDYYLKEVTRAMPGDTLLIIEHDWRSLTQVGGNKNRVRVLPNEIIENTV